MKVMKFGGSTFKTPEMINNVANIIINTEGKKVVVISALHGQTNEIREYISKIRTEKKEIDTFIDNIRIKHFSFAKKAISDKKILKNVLQTLDKFILKLERLLYGIAYTEELTPRTTDLILSSAERMSVYIMEGVLICKGANAKAYEADQIGIVTDGVFCNATADLKSTERNLRKTINPEIEAGIIPLITGFFGSDSQGRTCTFGRNGSDYSAAVIANALNASVLELWKDVDGFMSADPNIVKNAYTINRLSYDEAAELAHFGVGLLHPRTVEPVRSKIIPIDIKNVQRPNGKGTTIEQKSYVAENIIKSVAYSTDLAEIKVSAIGAGHRPGVLSSVSRTLNEHNINIYSVATSQTHLSLLIFKADLQRCISALDKISSGMIKQIGFQKDVALVCVVGEGAHDAMGLAGKIFTAVANAGVNMKLISAGASSVASHFIIQKKDLEKTVSAIHDEFCNDIV